MADNKTPSVRAIPNATLAGSGASPARPGVLSLNIREKRGALRGVHAVPASGGGIFIPTLARNTSSAKRSSCCCR